MSGPSGWMEVWLWVTAVTLISLGTADGTGRDARPGPSGFFPAPVWKFAAVSGREGSLDLARPQFRCSDTRLWLRLSLVRHAKARLADGIRLLALPKDSAASVRRFGSVLLLQLPYGSEYLHLQVSNGKRLRQLEVFYFDSLLQSNLVALASCEDPASAAPSPWVHCGATQILVRLPLGSEVLRVKDVGGGAPIHPAVSRTDSGSRQVLISTGPNRVSAVEIYFELLGVMSVTLAACDNAAAPRRHKIGPRSVLDLDLGATTEEPPCWTSAPAPPASYGHSPIFEMWGYGDIPAGPLEEDNSEDILATPTPAITGSTRVTTQEPCWEEIGELPPMTPAEFVEQNPYNRHISTHNDHACPFPKHISRKHLQGTDNISHSSQNSMGLYRKDKHSSKHKSWLHKLSTNHWDLHSSHNFSCILDH
ncbi:uncharacterized protein LOC144091285 [Stigmatopora argus]